MKKIIIFILVIALVFSLSGCTYRAAKPNLGVTTPTVNWKDGTYEGRGDKWKYGNEGATVIVSDSMIAQITLRKYTNEDEEVIYEERTGNKFKEDLAKKILLKQSTEVDDISGATISSKNWKLAVERALEQAEVK